VNVGVRRVRDVGENRRQCASCCGVAKGEVFK